MTTAPRPSSRGAADARLAGDGGASGRGGGSSDERADVRERGRLVPVGTTSRRSQGEEPEPYLHEASVGVRFGDPLPQDVALAKQEDKRDGSSNEAQGVRVMLGVIRPPTRWYYGVDGGYRLRASVEASAGSGAGFFSARFDVNTPDTLTLYPYAMNAAELYVSGAYTN